MTNEMRARGLVGPSRGPSRGGRRARVARDRRGAVYALLAVSAVVLLMFVGVGLDFAKAYAARTRVKTAADAAAMAGAVQLLQDNGSTQNTSVPAAARAYGALNVVEGGAGADSIAVKAAVWNYASRTVTYPSDPNNYGDSTVNAVEVTSYYSAPTLFMGAVQGLAKITLKERSVAALGGVAGRQSCLKPMAIPYQSLINQLYPTNTPSAATYSLSATDVNRLTSSTTPTTFIASSGGYDSRWGWSGGYNPYGEWSQAITYSSTWQPQPNDVPHPYDYLSQSGGYGGWGGYGGYSGGTTEPFAQAVATSTCPDVAVAPNDSTLLQAADTPDQLFPMQLAYFCSNNGGTLPLNAASTSNAYSTSGSYYGGSGFYGPQSFSCPGQPIIRLPVWDKYNANGASSGWSGGSYSYRWGAGYANTPTYHVRYVAAFRLTGYGNPSTYNGQSIGCPVQSSWSGYYSWRSNLGQFCGYFVAITANGSFANAPGPVQKAALVQ